MEIAKEEFGKRTTKKSSTVKKTEPTWMNKDIEADAATEEDIKAFKERLKNME